MNERRKFLFILGATQYEVKKDEIIEIEVEMDEIRTKIIYTHIVYNIHTVYAEPSMGVDTLLHKCVCINMFLCAYVSLQNLSVQYVMVSEKYIRKYF